MEEGQIAIIVQQAKKEAREEEIKFIRQSKALSGPFAEIKYLYKQIIFIEEDVFPPTHPFNFNLKNKLHESTERGLFEYLGNDFENDYQQFLIDWREYVSTHFNKTKKVSATKFLTLLKGEVPYEISLLIKKYKDVYLDNIPKEELVSLVFKNIYLKDYLTDEVKALMDRYKFSSEIFLEFNSILGSKLIWKGNDCKNFVRLIHELTENGWLSYPENKPPKKSELSDVQKAEILKSHFFIPSGNSKEYDGSIGLKTIKNLINNFKNGNIPDQNPPAFNIQSLTKTEYIQ